ncbi:MAG: DUF2950 family protein, partial [Candidatus Acidiferrum sp.]
MLVPIAPGANIFVNGIMPSCSRKFATFWARSVLSCWFEILARRIGRDELTAIAASSAVAEAQAKYFRMQKQYAQKFISDEGTKDGLYWPVAVGQTPSPLEDVRDFAKAAGYTNADTKPQPFDGYYFRILTRQGDKAKGGAKDYIVNGKMTGGFAVLAYPAEYRNSGIMTFVV